MNGIFKLGFNGLMSLITGCINQGQKLLRFMESKRMYTIPTPLNPQEFASDYKRYKDNMRRYGFKPVKRDFRIFRNYMLEGGTDPALIVPSIVVHNYLTAILNPIPHNAYFEDKNMFDRILPKDILPKTLFRRMDGLWYDGAYKSKDFSEVIDELDSCPEGSKIIVKPSKDSSSGKGVRVFELAGGRWCDVQRKDSHFKLAIEGEWGDNDLVIQEVVKQHPFMASLSPTAVCTMRIVVYNSPVDRKCHIIWRGIRVGAEGSVTDNNHTGGVILGVDKNGKLHPFGTDQYGKKYERFNDVDYTAQPLVIPEFDKIIELALDITPRLLPHRFVAYDIALTDEGKPVVIEYNLRAYGGWLCQFAGDPMLGDKTDEILQYLARNKSKGQKVFYKIN